MTTLDPRRRSRWRAKPQSVPLRRDQLQVVGITVDTKGVEAAELCVQPRAMSAVTCTQEMALETEAKTPRVLDSPRKCGCRPL